MSLLGWDSQTEIEWTTESKSGLHKHLKEIVLEFL